MASQVEDVGRWLGRNHWAGIGALAAIGGLILTLTGPPQPPSSGQTDGLGGEPVLQVIAPILDHNKALADQVADLSQQLGVRNESVRTFLRILDENPDIPPEDYGAALARLAQRHKDALDRLATLEAESPDLGPILEGVRARIDAGDYDGAEEALDEAVAQRKSVIDQAEEAVVQARLEGAILLAEKAQMLWTRFDDLGAAALFAEAADTLPDAPDRPEVAERRTSYRIGQANALVAHGERWGGTESLTQAITLMEAALANTDRATKPHTWAAIQGTRGDALMRLGERTGDLARLEAAVKTYRWALEERTRDHLPLDWATTQNNLGIALQALGERAGDPARLEAAVEAYHAALEERTRDTVPMDWAITQNNLGIALGYLGERAGDPVRLKAAVEAYHAALKEWTRDRVPLLWAATQNNLGNVLLTLGERSGDPARLEAAVEAYHAALEERTRDRAPMAWAMTQNNLGIALEHLGERSGDPARLKAAVEAYHAALKEWTRDQEALLWATTQNNLGHALAILGKLTGDTEHLETALTVTRLALQELTRTQDPMGWALAQDTLGTIQRELGALRQDPEMVAQAITAFEGARAVFRDAGATYYVEGTDNNLARARQVLADLTGGDQAVAR